MMERLRRWRYGRKEARVSGGDDFAEFEKWFSGPWTPDVVSLMPWDILMKGPQLGPIDAESRRVIDLEIGRRFRSKQPMLQTIISVAALIVSLFALYD